MDNDGYEDTTDADLSNPYVFTGDMTEMESIARLTQTMAMPTLVSLSQLPITRFQWYS